MSFEDVEFLKDTFTLYGVPEMVPVPKTHLVVKKRSTTYTRLVVSAPIYGAKYHFKMLMLSVFSKLKTKNE